MAHFEGSRFLLSFSSLRLVLNSQLHQSVLPQAFIGLDCKLNEIEAPAFATQASLPR